METRVDQQRTDAGMLDEESRHWHSDEVRSVDADAQGVWSRHPALLAFQPRRRTGYHAGQQRMEADRRSVPAPWQRQLRGLCLGDHGREATARCR